MATCLLGVAIIATACSSSPAGGDAAELADVDATSGVVASVPELAALGDLVGTESKPVSATFDGVARSLQFGVDSSVVVPAGAFTEQTVVTAMTVDLDFARFVPTAPAGALYVVSTEEHVVLGTPVFLEVAKPSDSVSVMQLSDGVWREVTVAPGPTTRVPIEHFSDVTTAVVDVPDSSTGAIAAIPTGDSPSDFLLACFAVLDPLFHGYSSEVYETYSDQDKADFGTNMALSLCTNALVNRLSPLGQQVSTACVGDKIGGEIDIQQAVDLCASEATNEPESVPSAPEPDTEPEPPAQAIDEVTYCDAWATSVALIYDFFDRGAELPADDPAAEEAFWKDADDAWRARVNVLVSLAPDEIRSVIESISAANTGYLYMDEGDFITVLEYGEAECGVTFE